MNRQGIDIIIAATNQSSKKFWGDYHYAVAMKREFQKMGYNVSIKTEDIWYQNTENLYCINLRGKKRYKCNHRQINIIWIISHPDLITRDEVEEYDIVFVASHDWLISDHQIELLQCTGFDRKIEYSKPQKNIIFVGNTRGQKRFIVEAAIKLGYELDIIGRGWKDLGKERYVIEEYIEYNMIPQLYSQYKVILCDHWDDMRKKGFISNRVYDALYCGKFVVSDYFSALEEKFSYGITCCRTLEEVDMALIKNLTARQSYEDFVKLKKTVEKDTFFYRCKKIMAEIEK